MKTGTVTKATSEEIEEFRVQWEAVKSGFALFFKFVYFSKCNALKEYCDKINHSNLEISWFRDKVLRFEFETEEEFKKRKSFLFAG